MIINSGNFDSDHFESANPQIVCVHHDALYQLSALRKPW